MKKNSIFKKVRKLHRYLMDWSEADNAWQVVYAYDFEEAKEKFEKGDFKLE
jgi:hypothetical protein